LHAEVGGRGDQSGTEVVDRAAVATQGGVEPVQVGPVGPTDEELLEDAARASDVPGVGPVDGFEVSLAFEGRTLLSL
jgi:hypothetical protein